MALSKSDLINQVAEKTGITKAKTEEMIKATLEGITNELATGGSITLIGFGTFKVQNRNARTGRNPKTGEAINIPAKKIVKFSTGKTLEEKVDSSAKPERKVAKKK